MTDTQKILEALQSGNFNFNQLIQLDDFKWVLKSILDTGENEEWKADLIEFINSDSSDNASTFFYNMLPFVRFIDESDKVAAFTAPDHRIYMNAPKGFGVGKAEYKWEFIYYHECLHQLWDTFDVEKNIIKQFGSCDHEVLNIAADCVINDFLHVNKKMPYPIDGLVSPEFIMEHYGVEYDRKRDTQFGLYEKLMKVVDKIKADQPPEQPGGTIKPGKINKVNTPPGGGGGGQDKNYPPEFVRGWTDAIKDVLNKKVDPLTYVPKTPVTLYDQGYNAAMDKIRKGIVDGIDVPASQGGDGGTPPKSNLPEIPWDKPAMPKPQNPQGGQGGKGGSGSSGKNDPQEQADNAQKSANDAQQAADDAELAAAEAQSSGDKSTADRASSAASKARQAAQEAQDAADKAQEAAAKGDAAAANRESKRAEKKASDARSAADEAKNEANKSDGKGDGADAAESARQASDVADHAAERAETAAGESGSSKAKSAAAKAKKAAEESRDAADKAMDAAMDGNDELAKKEAKKAIEKAKEATEAANDAQAETDKANGKKQIKGKEGKSSSNDTSGPGGYQHGYDGWKDLNEPTSDYWKKLGDDEIKKHVSKISGAFGDFVRKCKLSETEEKKEGVVVRARKSAAWNKALEKKVDAYVYQRVLNKRRETEPTYSRIKRGSRPIKFGEPIQPGIKIKEDKLNINVAFYIDRSGSMGQDSVDSCFSLAYQISDRIRKEYKHERVVGDIGMKYFAFNSYMEEIQRGKTVSCGGTTMSVKEILEEIEKQTGNYLINIIITDLETDINKSAVTALVKKMPGMFFIISNQAQHEAECRDIERICKGKFVFIQSNSDWSMG